MSDHDAIQLAANQTADSSDAASTLLGSQKIDTQAPLILYSSLFLIIPIFFLILTPICRSTSPSLGSSLCPPRPKYQW